MALNDQPDTPKVLQLYLELSQYPILARRIRQRMREEVFARGVVTREVFEAEVHEKAIRSQQREGIVNPLVDESPDTWQLRIDTIRDYLTDFYFAYNLPHDLFERIVQDVLSERRPNEEIVLAFNPEMAPWDLLFSQGAAYENYPPEKRAAVEHHLREIRVVLIKAMISDQLSFVRVARDYFTVHDLIAIRAHRYGRGKIGGKAAGMLLAYKVLQRHARQRGIDADRLISIPDSWYVGSDVFYDFHQANDLFRFMNQKYKRPEQMRTDYPPAYNAYLNSQLPEYVQSQLRSMLDEVGSAPIIVRSSSLLEDNFNTSFAGKYDSFFLPNQASPEENQRLLQQAIIRVYASVIRPEALIYRERMGLTDYDERMGILIQRVEGRRVGRYFFPDFAGVGFSHNPYAWSPRIDPDQGLLRLVTGLGTRAVDRVGTDYPRMVALSHPTLRPEAGASAVRKYSQHSIDVLDLEENDIRTVPVTTAFNLDHPSLGAIFSTDEGGYIRPLISRPLNLSPQDMIVTFENLLGQDQFVGLMRDVLGILEEAYQRPVDVEFAGELLATYPRPQARIALLQCRTLSRRDGGGSPVKLPEKVPEEDILFTASRQVPQGCVDGIRYIVYVDPRAYAHIPEPHTRIEIGQVVSRLNHALADEPFILVGPGRWGTSNIQLGVKVTYADIYNTKVLIEVAIAGESGVPEASYGTHFFQDLVEANIYPVALYPDDKKSIYREDFFRNAPNALSQILPADERFTPYIKVIDVPSIAEGRRLAVVMSSEQSRAIGYLGTGSECKDAI